MDLGWVAVHGKPGEETEESGILGILQVQSYVTAVRQAPQSELSRIQAPFAHSPSYGPQTSKAFEAYNSESLKQLLIIIVIVINISIVISTIISIIICIIICIFIGITICTFISITINVFVKLARPGD